MQDNHSPDSKSSCSTGCDGIYYWATLVVAVLAVPGFAIIVLSFIHATGIVQVVLFVLACWLCTYLGMRIMRNPKISEKMFHHKHHD